MAGVPDPTALPMSRFLRVYLLAIALPAALLAVFGARLLAQGSA